MKSMTSLVQKYMVQSLNIIVTVPGVPVGYVSLKRRKYWPNSIS